MVVLERFVVGPIQNNIFLIVDEQSREAAIVDPGFESHAILRKVGRMDCKITMILNTHGHVDHTAENAFVKRATRAKIAIHWADAKWLEENSKRPYFFMSKPTEPSFPDILLTEGSTVSVGSLKLSVLHTRGHTKGSSCFYLNDQKMILTGDTLFAGTYGRTDLPGGDDIEMAKSLLRLSQLPSDVRVYPGHGPSTTIGSETWITKLFKSNT